MSVVYITSCFAWGLQGVKRSRGRSNNLLNSFATENKLKGMES